MKTVTVYTKDGSEAGTVDLPDEIFGIEPSTIAIYQVVKAHLANRRQGNASTKSRSEVNVTKSKPWRQKGTGRARAGSANSSIWVGGGIAFGPKPRSYDQQVNRKVKRLGIKSAYSIKAAEDKIKVVEDFTLSEPKTREMVKMLKALGLSEGKVMFLTGAKDDVLYRSSRNIPTLSMIAAENANTYDIMNSDVVLFTRTAVDRVKEVLL
ncbi:MAG: 50S ribosomal protein L4 [Candidatus Latescibacter sp.]|nr:50S ribosomal protein L4 [Candidatus Latescibacter sp.]